MTYSAIIRDSTASPPASRESVHRLYFDEGRTLSEIGQEIGCSRQRLARWMEFWGLERNNSNKAMHQKRQREGKRGPNWKGGQWYSKAHDTWWTYAPQHPRARHHGGVPTHILVAEEQIGRAILPTEVVHHLDENRSNNTPTNLCVMLRGEHMWLHRTLGRVGTALLSVGKPALVRAAVGEPAWSFIAAIYIRRRASVSGLLENRA